MILSNDSTNLTFAIIDCRGNHIFIKRMKKFFFELNHQLEIHHFYINNNFQGV